MLTIADDIEVVGEVNTHERAVDIVSEAKPDVVLLDLEMPSGGAEETVRRILRLPQPPKIVVTMHDVPRLIQRFIGGGMRGADRAPGSGGGPRRTGGRPVGAGSGDTAAGGAA